MKSIKRQQGMATILLVLLIGLTTMIITATVAKTLLSHKEANVAAHAQTNAQVMGWAGVSAFRAYIFKTGSNGIQNLQKLQNSSVPLRNDVNQKVVMAKNIQVIGCVNSGPCTITADISSNNISSQAATTIHAVYNLEIKEGQISVPGEMPVINYAGDTFMSGTTLAAEVPNTKAIINIDGGHASIQAGFKTQNISKLTINVKKDSNGKGGDVIIDCSYTACGNIEIDINAEGYVHIINPGNFGNIRALEWVKLQTGVTAKNIEALGTVHLGLKSSAQNIRTLGKVELSEGSSANNISTNGDVQLLTNVKVNSIQTIGAVSVSVFSRVADYIYSGKEVNISNSTVGGDVKAYEYVDIDTSAKIYGSVYARNLSKKGIGTYKAAVRISTSWIGGNVYADGHLRLLDSLLGEDVKGNVYLTGEIKSVSITNRTIKGNIQEKKQLADIPGLSFTVPPAMNEVQFRQDLKSYIKSQMEFQTKIDVRAYKQDANYIFTTRNGMARVYLNQLRNEATQITYIYENGKQYAYPNKDIAQKYLVSDSGFYLGKYQSSNQHYVGAICLEVIQEQSMTNSSLIESGHKSGYCKTEIIGYLPRVSMDITALNGENRLIFGWPKDYDFTLPDTFYIRSTGESSINNAAFAPGIMYFEGKLIISGDANINADSMTTTFTNTFLAEGSIDAIAMSPRIYSPYNISREGSASLICSRDLSSVNGKFFNSLPPSTTPATLSNKFLTPINLCKDSNNFSYGMNKKTDPNDPNKTTQIKVKVDEGTANEALVEKLDLGLVALMSNKVVRIGSCARIYGDVLAKSSVEGSASCGITDNTNAIYGSISSEGKSPTSLDIQQNNTFGAGSKIVIPKQEYTNTKATGEVSYGNGLRVEKGTLRWAKYL